MSRAPKNLSDIIDELEFYRGDVLSMTECVNDNLDRILEALRDADKAERAR